MTDWREIAKEFADVPGLLGGPNSTRRMAEEIVRLRGHNDELRRLLDVSIHHEKYQHNSRDEWRAYSEKLREALKKIDDMSDDNGAIQAVIYDALALKKPGDE